MDHDRPRGAARDEGFDRGLSPVADDQRDRAAERRDHGADIRDAESKASDERADARDERAEVRERAGAEINPGSPADRAEALQDRRKAAGDRIQAADDRRASSADRARAAGERTASSIDDLTGAYRREAGIRELRRELARARRVNKRFVVAFIDVNHLKTTNDSLGHEAGDRLLCKTTDSIRAHFRPYDLVVRYGGDEFIGGLPGMTIGEAAKRFSLVNADLMATQGGNSVDVGLAEFKRDESLEELIARADSAMYDKREQRLMPEEGLEPPTRGL